MADAMRNYKQQIRRRMIAAGTWGTEYMAAVNRLADLYVRRDAAAAEFDAAGGHAVVEHAIRGGARNLVRSPYLVVIADLNAQMLTLERELGLTPNRRAQSNDAKQTSSGFATALQQALDGAGEDG